MGVPHPETVGQWLKPGKPFCEVGDPHHLEAHLIVDQSDIDLVRLGHRAWVKVYGRSENTYLSEVSEIAKRNRDEIPPELSNVAGGEIAGKADPKTGAIKPQTAVYEVIIPIENPNLDAPAWPSRLRQDRWRHPHLRVVACTGSSQDVQFHYLIRGLKELPSRPGNEAATQPGRRS